MITSLLFAGRHYAVLGLARSGRATVDALLAAGARVTAWDDRAEARASILPGTGRGTATRNGVAEGTGSVSPSPLHQPAAGSPPRPGEDRVTLADPLELDLEDFDAIVVTPGLPLNSHPIAERAKEAGVPVIGDIELFAQARASLPPHKVVGITGTNGKSTVTALVHHVLKTAGVPATMGGNIGLPILAQEPLPEGGVYVLELSSYQIDLTQSLDCDVAVLLNVTPDHLDRYESFEAYAAAKARLFEMQSEARVALNLSVPAQAGTQTGLPPARKHDVYDATPRRLRHRQRVWPALQGPHNLANAAAATAACEALGIDDGAIEEGLRTYPGLPHRMERVREKGGVLFVNDSKATNVEAAAPALAAYSAVHWIVGGQAKTADLGPCADHLGHVRAAYAIGEAGPMFAKLLDGRVPMVERSGTLENAVGSASRAARAGETILLSPACASFDQFRDYEARGAAFRAAVEALA